MEAIVVSVEKRFEAVLADEAAVVEPMERGGEKEVVDGTNTLRDSVADGARKPAVGLSAETSAALESRRACMS